ncbi:MAG: PLD nuclease N-terminal domain-containing protein [Thermoleophilia bacterium]
MSLLVLGLVTLVQLTLMVWAIVDLMQRPAVTWNNKWIWAVIIVVFGLIGPIVYFVAGRPPQSINEYGDATAQRQANTGKRTSAVADLLYGPPGDAGEHGTTDAQRSATGRRGAADAQRSAAGDSKDEEQDHPSGDRDT